MFIIQLYPKILCNLKHTKQILSHFKSLGNIRYCSTNNLLSISNPKLQTYLQSVCDEYYVLKVTDKLDKINRQRIDLISNVVELYEQRKCVLKNLNSLSELKDEKDEDMIKLMEEEKFVYNNFIKKLDNQLLDALLDMGDEQDYKSLFLEVTAGVGGQEAMLFAREIFDMYCNYVDYKGWNSDIINIDSSDAGGIRHASSIVSGDAAYRFLKFEAGVHRVQRIPQTEKAGRIHTSTISVAVIPKPDDFRASIAEKDLKIETKRASGAGGQHVNTTDSAVRIVHLPTGIAVECQSERSQLKNKEIALKKLEAKLLQEHINKINLNEDQTRKSQVGQSLRNEKIRTYNYNQDRITDHRLEDGTIFNLKAFFEGDNDLDRLIDRLSQSNKINRLLKIIGS